MVPEWFTKSSQEKLPDSKIEIRVGVQECVVTVYLPDGEWDFGSCEWVDSDTRYTVLSIQHLS